ncbi:MAG: hypothetical protein HYU85_08380 [Chloroflexi bacterium]|nr:hypothetical protein [Chloroflexota bacterium]MBI3040575.1 hypothetical protein [Chloroflexota bacterium]
MDDWKQKADAALAAIDELRRCFANMVVMAESMDKKLHSHDEASLKVLVQEVIQIAKDTETKLLRIYHACELLAKSCDDKVNLSGIAGEQMPDFRGYVHKKYAVELDEDLVLMIEDLIKRQKEKLSQQNTELSNNELCSESRSVIV